MTVVVVISGCHDSRDNHAQFHAIKQATTVANASHKMGLNVDANISFMFKEWPNFIERYKAAAEAGYFMFFLVNISCNLWRLYR